MFALRAWKRRGPGWEVVVRLGRLAVGYRGELHYKAVRHAGDTPRGGFV